MAGTSPAMTQKRKKGRRNASPRRMNKMRLRSELCRQPHHWAAERAVYVFSTYRRCAGEGISGHHRLQRPEIFVITIAHREFCGWSEPVREARLGVHVKDRGGIGHRCANISCRRHCDCDRALAEQDRSTRGPVDAKLIAQRNVALHAKAWAGTDERAPLYGSKGSGCRGRADG